MHDFHTKRNGHADKYESPENILRKWTIKILKKLKIDLMKITESSVEGMIKEYNKAGNKKIDRRKEKKIRIFSPGKNSCFFSLFHRKETDM